MNADDATPSNDLAGELRQLIRTSGPISVAHYMHLCLTHPQHGYYRKADAIGASGDFVTAPEISQIFGELIGIWVAATWQQWGELQALHVVELGPGRGTMMADVLRTLNVVPGLQEKTRATLIEISPRLRAAQRQSLADYADRVAWAESLTDITTDQPPVPTIILANEFFDALPITQQVETADGWVERTVCLDSTDALVFSPGDGAIRETRRDALRRGAPSLMDDLHALARTRPTALIAIDYGYEGPAHGDTLQAMQSQSYAAVLENPGRHDLTAHVDFAELATELQSAGFITDGPLSQAEFLAGLGFAARLERLRQGKSARDTNVIDTAAHRLVADPGMGTHFRVLGARSAGLPPLIPFPARREPDTS